MTVRYSIRRAAGGPVPRDRPVRARRVSRGERRVMFDVSTNSSKPRRLLRVAPAFDPLTFSLR